MKGAEQRLDEAVNNVIQAAQTLTDMLQIPETNVMPLQAQETVLASILAATQVEPTSPASAPAPRPALDHQPLSPQASPSAPGRLRQQLSAAELCSVETQTGPWTIEWPAPERELRRTPPSQGSRPGTSARPGTSTRAQPELSEGLRERERSGLGSRGQSTRAEAITAVAQSPRQKSADLEVIAKHGPDVPRTPNGPKGADVWRAADRQRTPDSRAMTPDLLPKILPRGNRKAGAQKSTRLEGPVEDEFPMVSHLSPSHATPPRHAPPRAAPSNPMPCHATPCHATLP